MRVGMIGQRQIPELELRWLRGALDSQLAQFSTPIEGFTSLATDIDQTFATMVLARGGALYVVVPSARFPASLAEDALDRYQILRRHAREVFELEGEDDPAAAYRRAARYIVDSVHALFAAWDDAPPTETADAIEYAHGNGRPVIHFEPVARRVRFLNGPGTPSSSG